MPKDSNPGLRALLIVLQKANEDKQPCVVIDAQGDVVGILSSLDVLRWLAVNEGYVLPRG